MMSRIITLMFYQTALGSSPRVWGQDFWYRDFEFPFAIIPMRVGTSLYRWKAKSKQRNHPHACGDKPTLSSDWKPILGSSPRVWGQDPYTCDVRKIYRIIPTRVGTSLYLTPFLCSLDDHPHACGDKYSVGNKWDSLIGSSPRVWGQGTHRARPLALDRIIPTRVGTSC